MRILVFSDTHHTTDDCIRIINLIKPSGLDMILHAGDCTVDAEDLSYIFPEIPLHFVRGNNDFSRAPSDMLINAGGHRIFLTHGHGFGVKYDDAYRALAEHAFSVGADCAVFGHTHIPYCAHSGKLILLNPGSIKYGRTYGIIETQDGRIKADVLKV